MRYRMLKVGEVIEATDEYYCFHNPDPFNPVDDRFIPVRACSVGQAILACNVKYYRRSLTSNKDKTNEPLHTP